MVQPVQTQTPTLPRFGANFGFVLRVALQSLGKCSAELLPCSARVGTEGNVAVGLPGTSLNHGCLELQGEDRDGEGKQPKLFC